MLQMALADFDVVSKDPRYLVQMSLWHEPGTTFNELSDEIPVCYVCLAGAVMARTLEAPIDQFIAPWCYSVAWERVFMCLNLLRTGVYGYNDFLYFYPVRSYHANRTQWRIDMEHFMEYLMLFDL